MTDNFDPYAPQETVFTNFGEIAYYEWMEGTWPAGEQQPVEYDKSVHTWHQTYHHFQAFPIGRDQSDFEQWVTPKAKEWHILYASLNNVTQNASKFLEEHVGKSFFAKWEKVKARQYKSKKDGEMKDVYAYKILAVYQSLEECKAQYNDFVGNEPLPEGSKMDTPTVEALPLAQAIGFAETLTRQAIGSDNKVDLDKLTASFQAMPMLAELKVDLPEVQEVIKKVEKEALPF
jgi:hypothetical protein